MMAMQGVAAVYRQQFNQPVSGIDKSVDNLCRILRGDW